jgi:hypothetical protein
MPCTCAVTIVDYAPPSRSHTAGYVRLTAELGGRDVAIVVQNYTTGLYCYLRRHGNSARIYMPDAQFQQFCDDLERNGVPYPIGISCDELVATIVPGVAKAAMCLPRADESATTSAQFAVIATEMARLSREMDHVKAMLEFLFENALRAGAPSAEKTEHPEAVVKPQLHAEKNTVPS